MRAGRKRKITLAREPNGRLTREPVTDLRQKLRNAGVLAVQADSRICAVYMICPKSEGKPVKIGISVDPKKRLASLQISHWAQLHLAKEIWLPSEPAAFAVERLTHQKLTRDGVRLNGEWFGISADEAELEVMNIISSEREKRY